MKESPQVLPILLLLRLLKAFLGKLGQVEDGVSVHNTHVMNTVRLYLSEVADQHIFLLLGRLVCNRHIFKK